MYGNQYVILESGESFTINGYASTTKCQSNGHGWSTNVPDVEINCDDVGQTLEQEYGFCDISGSTAMQL